MMSILSSRTSIAFVHCSLAVFMAYSTLALLLWGLGAFAPLTVWAAPGAQACFATPNNGTTVFSSTDASAVRNALAAVPAGGIVKVAGYCAGAAIQEGTAQVALITKTVTMSGGYTITNWTTYNPTGNPTTLDAQGGGRVLVASVAVTIQGFTVTNGAVNGVSDSGGGLYAHDAITLTAMTFYSNSAGFHGGGAYFNNTASVTGTTFNSNTTYIGGGAYFNNTASVIGTTFTRNSASYIGGGAAFKNAASVTGTTFSSNIAYYVGGGAYFASGYGTDSSANVTGTTFHSNSVGSFGGGAYFNSANVMGVTFSGNIAGSSGGGAYFASGSNSDLANVTGATFSGNMAYYVGGGAYFDSAVSVTGTTFSGNMADYGGGGAWLALEFPKQFVNVLFARNHTNGTGAAMYVHDSGPMSLIHTTIVSPTAPTGGTQAIYVLTGTVYFTNTLIASHTIGIENNSGTVSEWHGLYDGVATPYAGSVTASGSITATTAFVNPATDNYRLSESSAAIDAGIMPDPNVAFDIDADARPLGGGYDIGYDEVAYYYLFLPLVRR